MDYRSLLNECFDHDVITFDVFDTLIIRDVLKPSDIFWLSYGHTGKMLRIAAEIAARKLAPGCEPNIDEISRFFPLPTKKELALECELCRANPEIKKVYDELVLQGKAVYAISDMYLDEKFISGLLKKCGYNIPVMVSCDQRCNKLTGELFRRFLKRYGYAPQQVIHIGDNRKADCDGARKEGIEPVLIKKDKKLIKYIPYNKKSYELAAFVNHGLNRIADPVERLGYEIVGPIVLSFCVWIHECKVKYGFEKLFFLARDMKFICGIYKALYKDDEAIYLEVSRQSLRSARHDPQSFVDYLKKMGCYGNAAVVDTGWRGFAQTEIEKYSKLIDNNTDLGGLYIGSKVAYRTLKRSERSECFLYSTLADQFKAEGLSDFLETLIGSNGRKAVSYKDGVPVYEGSERPDETQGIKKGAARFVSDWVRIKHNKPIDKRSVRKTYEKIYAFPLDCDIELIGSIGFEENEKRRSDIVTYSVDGSLVRHPGKWIENLKESAWKGAYFKKSGAIAPVLMLSYLVFNGVRLAGIEMYNNVKHKI